MPDHDCRIVELRVLPILRLGTGVDIDIGTIFAICALPYLIAEFYSPHINPGLVVTIQTIVASVWPLPSIIGRL
mgnify:CR=1 FL=1